MIRIIKKYPQAKLILIGQGNLKEYYEHMAEPYSTWYKQKLYYETTLRPMADSLKDKFIDEGEARVKYRRSEK